MKRGFFFTMDATLGIAMVTLLLGAMLLLGIATQKGGSVQAPLHAKSADLADVNFLFPKTGVPVIDADPATAITSNCREIYEYTSSGNITPKVRKCEKLG